MPRSPAPRTGGQVLVDALGIHGVDTVFCVPGESYLAALDALAGAAATIRTITCRQEGGAAYMAEAYGKLTGTPGVVMVTRGPGACNASVGVHTGFQDSTPMLVLIGQVARDTEYREAFQEIDYHAFYGPLCKWVAQVESAERLPELVSQAMHRACSGRPGPVALALPEDMLTDVVEVADTDAYQRVQPGVEAGAIDRMRTLLSAAKRPLVIAGGGGWSERACADLKRFAEANDLPTGAAFRNQDRLDNHHANYIGPFGVGASPAIGDAAAIGATARARSPGSVGARPGLPGRRPHLRERRELPRRGRRHGARGREPVEAVVGGRPRRLPRRSRAHRGTPRGSRHGRRHGAPARAPAGGRHPHHRRR
jgi:acetolactate synthase-1/2/3 large subunit